MQPAEAGAGVAVAVEGQLVGIQPDEAADLWLGDAHDADNLDVGGSGGWLGCGFFGRVVVVVVGAPAVLAMAAQGRRVGGGVVLGQLVRVLQGLAQAETQRLDAQLALKAQEGGEDLVVALGSGGCGGRSGRLGVVVVGDCAGGEGGKGHGGGRRRGRRGRRRGRHCAGGVCWLVVACVGGGGGRHNDGQACGRNSGGSVCEMVDVVLQGGDLLAQGVLDGLDVDGHGRGQGCGDAQGGQQARGGRVCAAHEDAQGLQVGQVGAQAAVGALAAEIGGPQAQVALADAEVDGVHGGGVRGGDDAEDVAVAWVGEEELVAGVEQRGGLVVELAAGLQQADGDVVLCGRGAGPPEGEGRGQGVGVDAVAQLAGERQQQREGGVGGGGSGSSSSSSGGSGSSRGGGRGGERGLAQAGGREGDVGRGVEHGRVGRVAAGRRRAGARRRGARGHGGGGGGGGGVVLVVVLMVLVLVVGVVKGPKACSIDSGGLQTRGGRLDSRGSKQRESRVCQSRPTSAQSQPPARPPTASWMRGRRPAAGPPVLGRPLDKVGLGQPGLHAASSAYTCSSSCTCSIYIILVQYLVILVQYLD